MSSMADRDRWWTFLEERYSDLLFLIILKSKDFVQGLVLRKEPASTGDIKYVRIGVCHGDYGFTAPFLVQIVEIRGW